MSAFIITVPVVYISCAKLYVQQFTETMQCTTENNIK